MNTWKEKFAEKSRLLSPEELEMANSILSATIPISWKTYRFMCEVIDVVVDNRGISTGWWDGGEA